MPSTIVEQRNALSRRRQGTVRSPSTLDPKIYNGAYPRHAPASVSVLSNGRSSRVDETDRWNEKEIRREGDKLYVTVLSIDAGVR